MGIIAKEIKDDISLKKYDYSCLPLLKELREKLVNAKTEICIERSVLVTEYVKEHENQIIQIQRAGAINHYLSNRKTLFLDNSMLAGNSTSKILGAPVYPEYLGLSIWPELETISTRSANPQRLSREDADHLNFEVYPYWIDKTILERTRKEKNPKQLKLMEKAVYFLSGKASVISHATPYYKMMLQKGLSGIIDEALEHIEALMDQNNNGAYEKIVFYKSVKTALQGIINYAENLASEALDRAVESKDQKQKDNFKQIAKVCSQVPANPPRSFREAANAILLCHIGVLAENVNMALNPGRLDQLLYPYFKKDYEAGNLSIKDALAICGCLWLKIGDNTNLVPETSEKLFGGAGSVPAVTLGGVNIDGTDAVNDLTYIMLRVTELLKIRDPNVNARYEYDVNSREYINRVSEVVRTTRAIPAFYNDKANIDTLVNQGVSIEDARDYAIIGCVELGSAGREYSSSSSILLNLTAAMDLALYNGTRPYISGDEQVSPETGDPAAFTTYKEFHDAFYNQLDWLLDQAVQLNEAFGQIYQKYLPTPLLSGLFLGPMDNGKDLIWGGAKYNSSGVTHIGFADVSDSLNAVQFALENKKATMEQIVKAVKAGFLTTEYEIVRNILLQAPKYGKDNGVSTANSKELVSFLYKKYQGYTNYRGGKYRPAFWTMTNHAGLGKIGAALPSGRKAHEVFSSGITPASQQSEGITSVFNSVGGLDPQQIPGGYALNIKYSPPVNGHTPEEYDQQFGALISGYFRNKGMQVQFNLQNYEDLIDARDHPENHKDMIVRVSGYSAYFKDLNDAMKEELIKRTQYDMFSGNPVPLNPDFAVGIVARQRKP